MLYIIGTTKYENGANLIYKAFDSLSHSTMKIDTDILIKIILSSKIHVVNARVQNNTIIVKDWANGISTETNISNDNSFVEQSGPRFVIIAEAHDNYKTVDIDGIIRYIKINDLEELVINGMVANCRAENIKGKLTLISEDTYTIEYNKKFEELIKSKYNNFIAKATMLGNNDTTFEYEIENDEVRLTKYTGRNTDLIIPSFITIIEKDAVSFKRIKRVNLNEGLKAIGGGAFKAIGLSASIERIEIPSTVELVAYGAFYGNTKLFNKDGSVNIDRFKLRDNQTIVLKQYATWD